MNIIGLDNKTYKWNPKNSSANINNQSSYHIAAKEVIKTVFPYEIIFEELSLPGTNIRSHSTLRVDFFLPRLKIGIEVDGEQHYEENDFFFKTKTSAKNAVLRDKNKDLWFKKNNLILIRLPYYDNGRWEQIIWDALKNQNQ